MGATGIFPLFVRKFYRRDPFFIHGLYANQFHDDVHRFQSDIIRQVRTYPERDPDFSTAVTGDFVNFCKIQPVRKNYVFI